MIRRSRILKDSLKERLLESEVLMTGGTPRVNNSPQGIIYSRKKRDYVQSDSLILRRQRMALGNPWRTLPILYQVVENGDNIFNCHLPHESEVQLAGDRVRARRLMKAIRNNNSSAITE